MLHLPHELMFYLPEKKNNNNNKKKQKGKSNLPLLALSLTLTPHSSFWRAKIPPYSMDCSMVGCSVVVGRDTSKVREH